MGRLTVAPPRVASSRLPMPGPGRPRPSQTRPPVPDLRETAPGRMQARVPLAGSTVRPDLAYRVSSSLRHLWVGRGLPAGAAVRTVDAWVAADGGARELVVEIGFDPTDLDPTGLSPALVFGDVADALLLCDVAACP